MDNNMRARQNFVSHHPSPNVPGRTFHFALPGRKDSYGSRKGGDHQCHVFSFRIKGGVLKEDNKKAELAATSGNSTQKDYLIRAAALVRKRGIIHQHGPDPTPAECLGITINLLRRRKGISLENISIHTGFLQEECVAFEAGLLPMTRVAQMLPAIAKVLELDLRPILSSNGQPITES